jgi:hypothetical protein
VLAGTQVSLQDAVFFVLELAIYSLCSFADGETLDGGLLLGKTERGLVGLGDLLGLLGALELDVAVRREVWADATMGSVGSSASRNSALNDGVVDHTLIDVELGSLSVGHKVDKEFTDSLNRLLGPSSLSSAELSALSVTAHVSIEALVWNNSLVVETRVHVLDGSLEFQTLDGASSFVRVLEVSA